MEVHRDLMAERALDDAAIKRIVEKHGLDPVKLAETAASDAVDAQLAETHQLAQAVGVNGTPTFIVGGSVIPGRRLERVAGRDPQSAAEIRLKPTQGLNTTA
jgi:protein-disulfide isomerase